MSTMKDRLAFLEADNARLRTLARALQTRFEEVPPGDYLALDDGELDGPYADIDEAARCCARDGLACTVLHVGERIEASPRYEDNEPLAGFGLDYPSRLTPTAFQLACNLPSIDEMDIINACKREARSFNEAASWA